MPVDRPPNYGFHRPSAPPMRGPPPMGGHYPNAPPTGLGPYPPRGPGPYPPSGFPGPRPSNPMPTLPAHSSPFPPKPPMHRPPVGGHFPKPPSHMHGGNAQKGGGYYWVPSATYQTLPVHAVRGGVDSDGTQIYVGRAYHDGDWCPAKVIPEKSIAYIPYGGQEHMKHEYEVLCEQRFEWMSNSGGNIPHNSVLGGRTSDGESLYVGRVYHQGSHTVGKVHPSHGCLYIPYGGEELRFDEYEILVMI